MKKKIFLFFLIVVIVGFLIFLFYRQNMFSGEILNFNILGPSTAKIGDEIQYTVQYKNNGNFVLQNAKLIFELPDNSLTEDGKTIFTQNLNDIYPGDQESVIFKGRLLGKDGDLKTAKASLSYVPKNITATYESDATFATKIDASPITFNFDLPSQIEQDKNLQYSINYFSNVNYPLENLSIKVDPTPGFDFVFADPTSLDNSEWKLQTLNNAQGGRINISGKVSGAVNQNLNFSAELGMWQSGNFIVIKQINAVVQVIQPLISISQQVNNSDSYVASPGDTLHYKIIFINTGSTPFDGLTMAVKLDNSILDMATVQADEGGQLQVSSNTITWNNNQLPQLKHLDSNQQGEVDFSVKVKDGLSLSGTNAGNNAVTDEVDISQISQKFTVEISPN